METASTIRALWAVVRDGQIVPLDKLDAPEGARALVTLLLDSEETFWQRASELSLNDVWDNAEDDRYGELL